RRVDDERVVDPVADHERVAAIARAEPARLPLGRFAAERARRGDPGGARGVVDTGFAVAAEQEDLEAVAREREDLAGGVRAELLRRAKGGAHDAAAREDEIDIRRLRAPRRGPRRRADAVIGEREPAP